MSNLRCDKRQTGVTFVAMMIHVITIEIAMPHQDCRESSHDNF